MNSTKIIAVVLGVLMIGFAGAFAYTYSDLSAHPQVSPNTAEAAVLGDAFSHWNDISIENSTLLGSQYASNATLQWIGGPLTGTYHGVGNITSTWNKLLNRSSIEKKQCYYFLMCISPLNPFEID